MIQDSTFSLDQEYLFNEKEQISSNIQEIKSENNLLENYLNEIYENIKKKYSDNKIYEINQLFLEIEKLKDEYEEEESKYIFFSTLFTNKELFKLQNELKILKQDHDFFITEKENLLIDYEIQYSLINSQKINKDLFYNNLINEINHYKNQIINENKEYLILTNNLNELINKKNLFNENNNQLNQKIQQNTKLIFEYNNLKKLLDEFEIKEKVISDLVFS